MRLVLLPIALLSATTFLRGAEWPAFQTLRYDEDWSVLKTFETRPSGVDRLKYLPLGKGDDGYLTLGGEARLKSEWFSEPVLNQKPKDNDGFLLQRYLLHADLHVTPWLRVFGQLQSSLEDFRAGGPRPTDRDDLDLHQAFLDLKPLPSADPTITLRAGRQEMAYGSQRLVSVRESPNNRLSFDAVRLVSHWGSWSGDLWVSQPVETDRGLFDDQRIRSTSFWGAYASGPLDFISGLRADFYYLGLNRDQARFARGQADEDRHTVGARLWGRRGALDWNFELAGQVGTFGSRDILAWTAASDTGWSFRTVPSTPRVFLRADIASGDRGGGRLGTFNPLFPRGAYFNEAALIGPQNLMDLQPGIEFTPLRNLKIAASCDLVWRESLRDGVYGVAGNLQVPPGTSQARHVGTFPSLSATWQAERHLSFAVYCVPYFLGRAITEATPASANGVYLSAVSTLRF